MMTPGRTLHRLAMLLCSTKTIDRIIEPAIADLQKEYNAADRVSQRACVLLAGYIAILKVIAVCVLNAATVTEDERRTLSKMLAASVGSIAAISALLTLPPMFDHSMQRWDAAIALIPQAVPLAIPMGVAIGIALGLSAQLTKNIVRATLLGGIIASVISFAVLAWVMPAANHAFRTITFRELTISRTHSDVSGPRKGHNEMTLSELRRHTAIFAAEGLTRQQRQFAFAFHVRFALAMGTLVLAGLLLAAPFDHRGLRALIAFAASCVYLALLHTGEALAVSGELLPPVAGAWLPNLVLVASAIVIASGSSRLRAALSPAR